MKILYGTASPNQPYIRKDKPSYTKSNTNKDVSFATQDYLNYLSSINRHEVSFTGTEKKHKTTIKNLAKHSPVIEETETNSLEDYKKVKNEPNGPEIIKSFDEYFRLPPDEYQQLAAAHLYNGRNTVVTAPTGTGKTLIAEYIICKNLDFNIKKKTMRNNPETNRTFYTTPLKALSEQKYRDFCGLFGEENVGIMTGDRKIKTNAPIVVMTTEIYKNMLKQNGVGLDNESVKGLKTVVFDEFHYMNDNDRGHVWEEAIMSTPEDVQILALSATARNSRDIKDWIQSINGKESVKETKLVNVPPENRHVPLKFYSYNPETSGKFELMSLDKDYSQTEVSNLKQKRKKKSDNNEVKSEQSLPESKDKVYVEEYITDLVDTLNKEEKLPAIVFIMSRIGCQEAIYKYKESKKSLLNNEEADKVQNKLNEYKEKGIYLGMDFDEQALKKGIAVHNAGILPSAKKLIEELFQEGLVKVVFATETLAAGINMPAKTTILTALKKPDPKLQSTTDSEENSIFRSFTPTEFQQMAGRAGRRGIDDIGNVIVVCPNEKTLAEAEKLAGSPSIPIDSKFKATYSSLASLFVEKNKISNLDEYLGRSFMAFDIKASQDQNGNKSGKLDQVIDKYNKMKEILVKKGYITKLYNDYETAPRHWNNDNSIYVNTIKGNVASKVRGVNEILLTELIFNGKLDTLSPEKLAGFCAALTPDEPRDKSTELHTPLPSDLREKVIKVLDKTAQNVEKLQSDSGMNDCEDKINLDTNMIYFVYKWAGCNDYLIDGWENIIGNLKDLNGKYSEGDFVRTISNTVNVLNQIKEISEQLGQSEKVKSRESFEKLAANAKEAVALLQKPPAWDNLTD